MLWTFGAGRSNAGVNGTVLHGRESLNLPRSSYLQSVSFILGRANASPSNTQGGSPVRESRPLGSVRGVLSNGHPYRDSCGVRCKQAPHGLFGIPQRSKAALGHPFVGADGTCEASCPHTSRAFLTRCTPLPKPLSASEKRSHPKMAYPIVQAIGC